VPTTVTVAELAALNPQELGVSSWLVIDQARIDTFADATDDHQWLHVDEGRAKDGPYGRTIAHGYLTMSLIPRLLREVLELSDRTRGVNYGIETVRFTGPVGVGSAIRLRASLSSAVWRPDGGLKYRISCVVEVDGSDRPAVVAEVVYLAYKD